MRCRGPRCGMTIYMVPGPTGVKRPLSPNIDIHPQCAKPTRDADGCGVLHHVDCVDREQFRKRKKIEPAR